VISAAGDCTAHLSGRRQENKNQETRGYPSCFPGFIDWSDRKSQNGYAVLSKTMKRVRRPRIPERWAEYYLGVIRSLKPGLTQMIVHLGKDEAELQAITEGHPAYGSAWRQRDFEIVTGAEFRKALEENHMILVGWKEIKKLWSAKE
jgi:hypothetical protein